MVLSPQEESEKKSEHQEMLLRLEWELEERQRYSTAGWSMCGVGSVPVRGGGGGAVELFSGDGYAGCLCQATGTEGVTGQVH